MKRFKVSNDSFNLSSRAYRMGKRHAEMVLEGHVELADYNDYFETIEWQGANGSVYTDMKGQVLQVDIW